MAPSPFRRRKAAKTVRNLAIAEAALALAKDRVGSGSRRGPSGKLLLIGGAVAAVGAAALLKRDKVAGLLPSRAGEPAPPEPMPPQPSNYDAPGPVANTATPIPAPDPQGQPPAVVDEAAEEAAAAAEAAAIGGTAPDYAGTEPGERADEAQIPLMEAGEGESEGQEQAEADLADNATYRDAGMTDAERQIEDAIDQAGQPSRGETPEPLAEPGGGISGRPYSGLDREGEPTAATGASDEPAADTAGETTSAEDAEAEAASDIAAQTADATTPDDAAAAAEASTEPTDASADTTAADDSSETAADTADQPTSTDAEAAEGEASSDVAAQTADDPAASAEAGDAPAEPASSDESAPDERSGGDSGDDDWRTWSGRSVNP